MNVPQTLDIMVYGAIGDTLFEQGVRAVDVAKQLQDAPNADAINVYINSAGGYVSDAVAIYNALGRHKARKIVHIDAFALSAASIIAMAGDEIRMAENGLMMIHDPMELVYGNSVDLRKVADVLDTAAGTLVATYAARTGRKPEDITAMMGAETWMGADEAKSRGFADTIVPAKQKPDEEAENILDIRRYRNAPPALIAKYQQRIAASALGRRALHNSAGSLARAKETSMASEKDPADVKPALVADEPKAPVAATVAELEAIAGADATFVLACFKAQMTLQQATATANAKLVAEVVALKAEKSKAAEVLRPKAGGPGIPDAKSVEGGSLGTMVEIMAEAKRLNTETKCGMTAALRRIYDSNPEAYDAAFDIDRPFKRPRKE